ncbi:MAG: DUF3109 family protein [Saprospiraceae bacterium]|nr:DUF3109 family protein [Saprospiraceae bacterium]
MLEVQGKIISLEVIENRFVCDLKACKGACCIEGDGGAPLETAEVEWLNQNIDLITPVLDEEGKSLAQTQRATQADDGAFHTPLKADGACIYSIRDAMGILQCSIEQVYKTGSTTLIKPISCHLYPIRIHKSENWEALNYDRWDICNPACTQGAKLKVPVYRFLQSALIRKYGEEFYQELDDIASQWISETQL